MTDERTGKDLKELSILEEPMLRIYIMLNSEGKVKIGKTKNIQQRYQSLCGSNGQGNKITRVYCSEETYLYTLENIMHDKFASYRIPSTEWFYDEDDPSGERLFTNAVEELKLLFSSASYEKCNEIRKQLYETNRNKGGDTDDH